MTEQRKYWIDTLEKIALPVLTAFAEGRVKRDMPVESPGGLDRTHCTYLEALGRTVDGIAPWLALRGGDSWEIAEREKTADLCRRAIASAVDPASPDFCDVIERSTGNVYGQPLVDLAFLCQGIMLAKAELWDKLSDKTKGELLDMLRLVRRVTPCHNNWVLFSATVEAAICVFTGECDMMRVDLAITLHEAWYKGGGVYGDGPNYSPDYYNSYVIQPMLIDVLTAVGEKYPSYTLIYDGDPLETVIERAQKYAAYLEKIIAPDGSFPITGRSSTYRMGAFRLLSQLALMGRLPDGLSPASVRGALTAVIRRCVEEVGTFDGDGWLRIGVCGSQIDLAESYISTGSLYLCTGVYLALGLPESDPFWSDPDEPWTWKRIWNA